MRSMQVDIAEVDTEDDDSHTRHDLNESLMGMTNGQNTPVDGAAGNVVETGPEGSPLTQGPDDSAPVPGAAAAIYDGAADAVELLATDPAPMVAVYTKKAMVASGHTLDIVIPDLESAGSGASRPSLHRPSHSLQVPSAQHQRTSAGSVASSQDQGSTLRRDPWHNFARRVRLALGSPR